MLNPQWPKLERVVARRLPHLAASLPYPRRFASAFKTADWGKSIVVDFAHAPQYYGFEVARDTSTSIRVRPWGWALFSSDLAEQAMADACKEQQLASFARREYDLGAIIHVVVAHRVNCKLGARRVPEVDRSGDGGGEYEPGEATRCRLLCECCGSRVTE